MIETSVMKKLKIKKISEKLKIMKNQLKPICMFSPVVYPSKNKIGKIKYISNLSTYLFIYSLFTVEKKAVLYDCD